MDMLCVPLGPHGYVMCTPRGTGAVGMLCTEYVMTSGYGVMCASPLLLSWCYMDIYMYMYM